MLIYTHTHTNARWGHMQHIPLPRTHIHTHIYVSTQKHTHTCTDGICTYVQLVITVQLDYCSRRSAAAKAQPIPETFAAPRMDGRMCCPAAVGVGVGVDVAAAVAFYRLTQFLGTYFYIVEFSYRELPFFSAHTFFCFSGHIPMASSFQRPFHSLKAFPFSFSFSFCNLMAKFCYIHIYLCIRFSGVWSCLCLFLFRFFFSFLLGLVMHAARSYQLIMSSAKTAFQMEI